MTQTPAAVLARSRFFSTLSKTQIARVLWLAGTTTVSCGKTLFSKGDPADAIYVVLNGEIAIEINSVKGRSVRVATLKDGAVFGELAALDGGKRTADARASRDTVLLRISKQTVQNLIAETPDFSMAIIKDLIEKLRNTDDQVEDISFKPLISRLAALLAGLARENPGHAALSIHITQAALAERLTATREKVNIHLQSIQRAKAIRLGRGRIDILDLEALASFIDER